jgi:voltage-gated potassium channel
MEYSSYKSLYNAIRNKKKELLTSLNIILSLTVVLTVILFFFENPAQPHNFDNVFTSFFWAISKYIQGTGGYGNFLPVTLFGQIIGTIVGILYIALIAVPSGIIAAAFVEEMTKNKENQELTRIRKLMIEAFFLEESNKVTRDTKKELGLTDIPRRIFSVDYCQSMLNLSDAEIYKTVGKSDTLRLRFRPGTNRTNIEYFTNNKSYGSYENRNSCLTVICATAARDAYIGHYTSAIAHLLKANYLSIENFSSIAMIKDDRFDFSDNIYMKTNLKASEKANRAYKEFCEDICALNAKNSYVLYFESVTGKRTDANGEQTENEENGKKDENHHIHILAGGSKGEPGFNKHASTVNDLDKLVAFYNELEVDMKKLGIKVFSHERHGSFDEYHLHNHLRRLGFNVISIFISTPLLNASENMKYFGSIRKLADTAGKHFSYNARV